MKKALIIIFFFSCTAAFSQALRRTEKFEVDAREKFHFHKTTEFLDSIKTPFGTYPIEVVDQLFHLFLVDSLGGNITLQDLAQTLAAGDTVGNAKIYSTAQFELNSFFQTIIKGGFGLQLISPNGSIILSTPNGSVDVASRLNIQNSIFLPDGYIIDDSTDVKGSGGTGGSPPVAGYGINVLGSTVTLDTSVAATQFDLTQINVTDADADPANELQDADEVPFVPDLGMNSSNVQDAIIEAVNLLLNYTNTALAGYYSSTVMDQKLITQEVIIMSGNLTYNDSHAGKRIINRTGNSYNYDMVSGAAIPLNTQTIILENQGTGNIVVNKGSIDTLKLFNDSSANSYTVSTIAYLQRKASNVFFLSGGKAAIGGVAYDDQEVRDSLRLAFTEIDAVASGAADGVATAGVYDAANHEIDVAVSSPGTGFSIGLTGIAKTSDIPAAFDDSELLDSIADHRALLNNHSDSLADHLIRLNALLAAPPDYSDADIDGSEAAFTGWDKNAADDFDGVYGSLSGVPSSFTPSAHNHAAADVTSGTFNIARIPTGTTSSTVALGNHTHAWAAITSKPTFSAVATSGSYNDLLNLPTLFDGNYNNLTNKPTLFDGQYSSLTGKPDVIVFSDTLSKIATKADLSTATGGSIQSLSLAGIALTISGGNTAHFTGWDTDASNDFDGNYNSLTNKPTLFDGQYSSLIGTPSLATVATSGSYNDLSNKPTIPAPFDDSELLDSIADHRAVLNNHSDSIADHLTRLNALEAAPPGYSDSDIDGNEAAFTGWDKNAADDFDGNYNSLTNKPTLFDGQYSSLIGTPSLATVATSGSYNDLSNKPTIPAPFDDSELLDSIADHRALLNNHSDSLADHLARLNTLEAAPPDYTDADIDGSEAAFTGWDKNAADDFDGAYGSLSGVPSSFSPSAHNHAAADVTSGTFNIARIPTGTTSSTVALGNHSHAWSAITSKPTFSTVATSGSYNDLLNLPTLFDGNYNNLTNKPTLFDGQYSSLTGTPSLATVATSGSYNDLSNKPTIPAPFDDSELLDSIADHRALLNNHSDSLADHLARINTLEAAPPDYTDADIDGSEAAFTGWDKNAADDFDGAYGSLSGVPSSFTPSAHNHAAADVTSGTFNIARIPTGTTSSSVALGNHTHTFASLTSKPTTLSGYGISDAATSAQLAAEAVKIIALQDSVDSLRAAISDLKIQVNALACDSSYTSPNLFNPALLKQDSLIRTSDQAIIYVAGWQMSGFMAVTAGQDYTLYGLNISSSSTYTWRDASNAVIGTPGTGVNTWLTGDTITITAPAGAVTIAFNIKRPADPTSVYDNLMFIEGDSAVPYSAYGTTINACPGYGGAGGVAYDQSLNTTDNVEFAGITTGGLKMNLPTGNGTEPAGLSIGDMWIDWNGSTTSGTLKVKMQ